VPGRSAYPGAEQFLPPSRSLSALRSAAEGCRGCDLYENATQTVFGRGPSSATLMLVGEQPGDVEDREGRAFVGPAGRLLDRALADAGLDGGDLYVTNAVKHFSFRGSGKRRIHQTPKVGQLNACRPWLRRELEAVRPQLVVCMGSTAARSVLGAEVRVLRDRGEILERDGLGGAGHYLITVHPSSVLRAPPETKDEAYQDFVADLRTAAAWLADEPRGARR
jgi:DNA polymerase